MEISSTACLRCRELKLKCSRLFPSCARCNRLEIRCMYPPRPNLKALAARRRRRNADNQPASPINNIDNSRSSQNPILCNGSLRASQAQILDLIELFFTHMPGASMLFDKKQFLIQCLDDQIVDFILHAVLALGSLFADNLQTNEGEQWARKASASALSLADCPSIDTIRACHILSWYWFAVGEARRAATHAHVAYYSALSLGFNSYPADQSQEQRCFWECWATASITLFAGSLHNPHCLLDQNPCNPESTQTSRFGLFNDESSWEAIKVRSIALWCEIRNFASQAQPSKCRACTFHQLEQRLKDISAILPNTPEGLHFVRTADPEKLPLAVIIYATYHQSYVMLYLSDLSRSNGASTVYRHAFALTSMIEQSLAMKLPPSCISPFVGFCLFAGALVYFSILQTNLDRTCGFLRSKLLSNLSLLDCVSQKWKSLRSLWDTLEPLLSKHDIRPAELTRHLLSLQESSFEGRSDEHMDLKPFSGEYIETILKDLSRSPYLSYESVDLPQDINSVSKQGCTTCGDQPSSELGHDISTFDPMPTIGHQTWAGQNSFDDFDPFDGTFTTENTIDENVWFNLPEQ